METRELENETWCVVTAPFTLLSVDYILFGDKKGEGDSHMLTMINKCPEKQRQHLEAIIKIFLNAVEK